MNRWRPPAGAAGGLWLTGLVLGLAAVQPAAGQIQLDQSSVRVDSVVVVGNQRHSANIIITRSGLRAGNVVRQPQIQDAIRRLFGSGDFSDVEIGVVESDDPERGVFYIRVEERPYITQYAFRGLERVDEDVIRDTIGLAQNSPLDPSRIGRARVTLLELLSNEGFPTASVDTLIRPDPAFSFGPACRVRCERGAAARDHRDHVRGERCLYGRGTPGVDGHGRGGVLLVRFGRTQAG